MTAQPNPYEAHHRARRANQIADQFRARILALEPDATDFEIARAAQLASRDLWLDSAEAAGVRDPSPATIAQAEAALVLAARPVPDRLAGLPR